MSREVVYHKSRGSIVLKPGTVTFVDDNLVTVKELKDCYGDRINIMSRETVEKYIVETAPQVEEIKELEAVREPQEEVTEEVEVAEVEVTGGAAPVEAKEEDLISNTGNEEIDAFLNGETDEVPEGTVEISKEEALKLQEEVKQEEVKQEEVKAEESQPVKKPVGKKPGKKVAGKKAVKK